MQVGERRRLYWQKNLRLTGLLLGVWFVVTFGVAYFAHDLTFSFFGWPFSFWIGSQGALIVYCVIVWFYARTMNRLDRELDPPEAH
jgi:putative solute:sodium symporter small subunit